MRYALICNSEGHDMQWRLAFPQYAVVGAIEVCLRSSLPGITPDHVIENS